MRLTVGPLPAAVYWRRRLLVLGVLVAIIALIAYNCTGSDPSDATSANPTPNPSTSRAVPAVLESTAASAPTGAPTANNPVTPPAGATPNRACADDEIAVTVATDNGRTEFKVGDAIRIYLKVKNISSRTCVRDVGALAQELRIQQGAQTVWSSDDCATGPTPPPDLHTFNPGEELGQFNVIWYGRSSTSCQDPRTPSPGEYQIVGRFGTRWSEPLTIRLT